jgi:hypothetical protein
MIGSLRGTILDRDLDGSVLVEVAGVGYNVAVTERTLSELEPGTETFLYVHHHVTETAETLFGFRAKDERITFQTLIKTNGVGPSIAMAVLATHPPTALVDIVANNDIAALTLVSGIGKKTAERVTGCRCRCSIRAAARRQRGRRLLKCARRSQVLVTAPTKSVTCCAICRAIRRAQRCFEML